MVAWSCRASSSSARPVRAAEPCLSMSSDDGGPGTGSSSVRRSRYNRGAFAGGRAWLGARFRVLAARSLFFRVGAGAFFRLVMRVVLGGVRIRGPFFRLLMRAVLGGVRAWLG